MKSLKRHVSISVTLNTYLLLLQQLPVVFTAFPSLVCVPVGIGFASSAVGIKMFAITAAI